MAKNVVINGVTYADVPAVDMPKADGQGDARFVDASAGNLSANDLRQGKSGFKGDQKIDGNVPTKAASDVTVSGKTVNIPSGIYDNAVAKSVADGTVTPGATVAGDEIGDTQTDYPVEITPGAAVSAGYVSGDKTGTKVTKYIQVEDKEITPTGQAQTIFPTAGKLIKKIIIAALSLLGTATPDKVLAGYTFYNTSLELKTGTATVPTVSQDSATKVLGIR